MLFTEKPKDPEFERPSREYTRLIIALSYFLADLGVVRLSLNLKK